MKTTAVGFVLVFLAVSWMAAASNTGQPASRPATQPAGTEATPVHATEFDLGSFTEGKYDDHLVRWEGVVRRAEDGAVNVVVYHKDRVIVEVGLEKTPGGHPGAIAGKSVTVEGTLAPDGIVGILRTGEKCYMRTLKNGRIVPEKELAKPGQPTSASAPAAKPTSAPATGKKGDK